MKLRVVGDLIIAHGCEIVASFNPQLLPTLRETAEELLMRGAEQSDWELRERVYEYETRLEELDGEIAGLRARLEEIEGAV